MVGHVYKRISGGNNSAIFEWFSSLKKSHGVMTWWLFCDNTLIKT